MLIHAGDGVEGDYNIIFPRDTTLNFAGVPALDRKSVSVVISLGKEMHPNPWAAVPVWKVIYLKQRLTR